MSSRETVHLPENLLGALRDGRPALLLTIDEDGWPHTAFTWTLALGPAALRFAADHGSQTLANLEREQRAAVQVIDEGLLFLVKGDTAMVKPQLAAAPFEIALMELQVATVKDQSWEGVRVRPLRYEWPDEQRQAMLAMERAVYIEMRKE